MLQPNPRLQTRKRKSNPTWVYHFMLLPGLILLLVFNVFPMFGLAMAFQDFIPTKGITGSQWVGWENFKFMLMLPDSRSILTNTLVISFGKLFFSLLASLAFALLVHEVTSERFKKLVQTVVYLPHFLSWVILAGVVQTLLSQDGILNHIVTSLGGEPKMWLADNHWFQTIIVGSHVWKEFGFGAIIFIAALLGISPSLYEAASLDGANRFQKLLFITLPSIAPTITLVAALSIGGILTAGFDQIFNLYNPLVYASGDVIDTWVYRQGLLGGQYSLAAAVGLIQNVVSMVLIVVSYILAYRFAGYRIF